jgi:tetraacyldisaccharide 4'-kinase
MQQGIRRFWSKRSFLNYLLLPLSIIYYFAHLLNFYVFQKPKKVKSIVICIGNVVVGGAGKTPFAIALAQKLMKQGLKIAFITRGYGSSASLIQEATLVDLSIHKASNVGDEAILLAHTAPTYVLKDRYIAACSAARDGAEVIIMDDGLQNNGLYKDYSFLVIDEGYGLGNGYVIPAGPLREPYKNAKNKVNTMVLITQNQNHLKHLSGKYDIIANIVCKKRPKPGQRYFAFCGIANPQKFFDTLTYNGFNIAAFKVFDDHYPYAELDIEGLIKESKDLQLITTEKDLVKIPDKYRDRIEVLPIELQFDLPKGLKKLFAG